MKIENKRAHFDNEVLETSEAGVMLTGAETKSFHEKRATINGSYVRVLNGELYLVNANFTLPSVPAATQSRSRKLLVHKREIIAWGNKIKEKKLTIVPISMYNKGRFIKVLIGLARSKKEFSKKETRKKRDIEREVAREDRAKID